ncbi:hypothetical protein RNZ50_15665 [Paracoccaceae bacterium Fryx2]|nr:hypothetical protein [Paracoccaceae bacterium Fryx2]
MDADVIIARLKARVADLGNRVAGAAEFAALTATGKAPQVTPAAHVIPTGIAGGKHLTQTGAYVQSIDRLFAVILTLRTQDASGARALARLDGLIEDIVQALAGWELGGRVGVVVFRRAALLRSTDGVFAYEITFSIADQLRITPS